jgi:hypothetical protein
MAAAGTQYVLRRSLTDSLPAGASKYTSSATYETTDRKAKGRGYPPLLIVVDLLELPSSTPSSMHSAPAAAGGAGGAAAGGAGARAATSPHGRDCSGGASPSSVGSSASSASRVSRMSYSAAAQAPAAAGADAGSDANPEEVVALLEAREWAKWKLRTLIRAIWDKYLGTDSLLHASGLANKMGKSWARTMPTNIYDLSDLMQHAKVGRLDMKDKIADRKGGPTPKMTALLEAYKGMEKEIARQERLHKAELDAVYMYADMALPGAHPARVRTWPSKRFIAHMDKPPFAGSVECARCGKLLGDWNPVLRADPPIVEEGVGGDEDEDDDE